MCLTCNQLKKLGEEFIDYFFDQLHEFCDERENMHHDNGRYLWASISKEVGWTKVDLEFPEREEIDFLCVQAEKNIDRWALVELLRYCRFLWGPKVAERQEDMDKMSETLARCRKEFCMG